MKKDGIAIDAKKVIDMMQLLGLLEQAVEVVRSRAEPEIPQIDARPKTSTTRAAAAISTFQVSVWLEQASLPLARPVLLA